jgi:hypothetical protein
MNPKHRPGSPMTLGDMRKLAVQRLIASMRAATPRRST